MSTLNIMDDVYALIGTSCVVTGEGEITGITGGVYKLRRPETSVYEDVVINALPVSGGDIQMCTVNVNIHVPDIRVTIGGRIQEQPNMVRLKDLAQLAVKVTEEHYATSYYLWVAHQAVIREEPAKEHYVNLRIEYRSHKSVQT